LNIHKISFYSKIKTQRKVETIFHLNQSVFSLDPLSFNLYKNQPKDIEEKQDYKLSVKEPEEKQEQEHEVQQYKKKIKLPEG
jgi:hypothetical protein